MSEWKVGNTTWNQIRKKKKDQIIKKSAQNNWKNYQSVPYLPNKKKCVIVYIYI